MAKLEFHVLDEPIRAPSRKPASVKERRLRTSSGETVTIRAIDANSETFSEDFLYVFAQNVRAARARQRKRAIGQ